MLIVRRLSIMSSTYHGVSDTYNKTLCNKRIPKRDQTAIYTNPRYQSVDDRVTCPKCISQIENYAIMACPGKDENVVW